MVKGKCLGDEGASCYILRIKREIPGLKANFGPGIVVFRTEHTF
jgi:hypothetical protein